RGARAAAPVAGEARRARNRAAQGAEASEPVERSGQSRLVAQRLGERARPLQVVVVLLERLSGRADARALDAGVDFRALAPRRGGLCARQREGLVVVRRRLGVRVDPGRAIAGEQRVLDRRLRLVAAREMVGEHTGLLLELIGVEGLDAAPDAAVEGLPPRREQALAHDVLDHGVLEPVLELREEARLVDEVQPLERLEMARELRRTGRDAR